MAAKYFAIGAGATTTLLTKNTNNAATQYTGLISSVRVSNNHGTDAAVIDLFLDGTPDYYIIKGVSIPAGVALDIDNVSFDINTHDLKLTHSGSNDLTVRIE